MTTGDRYVRLPEVLQRSGLSRRTIYRRMAAGTFPASVQLGENAVGWPASEFERWLLAPMDWKEAA
jgi:prophage regulatory protein